MRTITETYDKIKAKRVVKIKCRRCKKQLTRTISTYRTMNPFHRMTRAELAKENSKELIEIEKRMYYRGVECRSCEYHRAPAKEEGHT